jgi:hypothetical protein
VRCRAVVAATLCMGGIVTLANSGLVNRMLILVYLDILSSNTLCV